MTTVIQEKPRCDFFEYWDEAPQDWSVLLRDRSQRGETKLTIPVLWGVHEQSPGIRDFSKQSRFRVEKLLSIAHELKFQVELVLGFPPHPQCFPTWISQTEMTEDVPEFLWTCNPPFFSKIVLPSIRTPKIKDAFLSFIEELDSILSLYIAPEGPISDVLVDLTPLETSQSLMSDPIYTEKLKTRYPKIELLNKLFQTHYKDLSAVTTTNGFKVAESKRPWLLAFDYKWCREQVVEDYFKELINQHVSDRVRYVAKRQSESSKDISKTKVELAICFENTLIQAGENGSLVPLILGEQATNSCTQAFEWAKFSSEIAADKGVPFFTSSKLYSATSDLEIRNLVVLTGKYMASDHVRNLVSRINQGNHVYFPMGLPQLDENLNSHPFVTMGSKSTVTIDQISWFCIKLGAGSYYFPVKSGVINNPNDLRPLIDSLNRASGELNHG